MINGILQIIAAVLFAVISLGKEVDMVWLCVAGVYLLVGIVNLIVYAVKSSKKKKAAQAKEGA